MTKLYTRVHARVTPCGDHYHITAECFECGVTETSIEFPRPPTAEEFHEAMLAFGEEHCSRCTGTSKPVNAEEVKKFTEEGMLVHFVENEEEIVH